MKKEDFELLQPFFWDTDVNALSLEKNKKPIIERLIKLGRIQHVEWVLDRYSDKEIIDVIKTSSNLDKRTANYWALRYHIPKTEVKCFLKPSQIGYFV